MANLRVVVDTSEHTPLHFTRPYVKRSLDTGDYSLEGYENRICVERKSLPDLVKSVIHDWLRFSKCLRRMAAMDTAFIAVEAPITALMSHQYPSEALPESVRGKINAIILDFGIYTVFFDNPQLMAQWIENLFDQFEKRL